MIYLLPRDPEGFPYESESNILEKHVKVLLDFITKNHEKHTNDVAAKKIDIINRELEHREYLQSNKIESRQNKIMIWLTVAITVLTMVSAAGIIVDVYMNYLR